MLTSSLFLYKEFWINSLIILLIVYILRYNSIPPPEAAVGSVGGGAHRQDVGVAVPDPRHLGAGNGEDHHHHCNSIVKNATTEQVLKNKKILYTLFIYIFHIIIEHSY